MARRNAFIQKQFFNPLEILMASESKTVTLSGPELALVTHILNYASTHGPAVYGTKENRFPVPVMDELIASTLSNVSSDNLELGSWDVIKANEEDDISVSLTGPQVQLVRSVLSYAEDRGNAFFGVPNNDENAKDEYRAIVSDALSKL